jgi:hypothetical protein
MTTRVHPDWHALDQPIRATRGHGYPVLLDSKLHLDRPREPKAIARSARFDAPGTHHHVMIRGIEGREIFRGDCDRSDFLERLDVLVPELGFRCFCVS